MPLIDTTRPRGRLTDGRRTPQGALPDRRRTELVVAATPVVRDVAGIAKQAEPVAGS